MTAATGAMLLPLLMLVLIWAAVAVAVQGMLDPLDFLALQSIGRSMRDLPGSSFFADHWDFSKDPCTFSGVLCDSSSNGGSQRVVALNLGSAAAGAPGIRGRLDGAVGCLTKLRELTLVPGIVSGALPHTLGQCRRLQLLALAHNRFEGAVPDTLAALTELRTLDLGFNRFSGAVPAGVAALPALATTVLCHNSFSGAVPAFASRQLVRLDLKQNRLSGPLPALPDSLQYLSLSFNELSGTVAAVAGLRNLEFLDLSFNHFSGDVPAEIFGLPLSALHLERNALSGTVSAVSAPVRIPEVDLSFNLLRGQLPAALAYASNVYLNNNRFSGAVPQEFVDRLVAGQIRTLYLQHNYLTRIGLQASTPLPLTASLCVQYNCMVPAVEPPCPYRFGKQASRPTYQCALMG